MKKISVVLLALLMVFSFAACGNDTEAEGGLTIEEGVLSIALEPEYPPMEFKDDDGNLTGFDIAFGNLIAEKMGLKAEFVETGWDGIFLGLDANKYDCVISGVSITKERLESGNMLLSDPYLSNGQFVVVPKGYKDVKSVADLEGKKIGVQQSTTADEACRKQQETVDFEIVPYDTIQQAFLGLEAGHIEVIVVDGPVARYYVKNNADKFEVSKTKLSNEPVAVAMQKDNVELQEKINAIIAECIEDGSLAEISVEYFGEDITQNIDMTIE